MINIGLCCSHTVRYCIILHQPCLDNKTRVPLVLHRQQRRLEHHSSRALPLDLPHQHLEVTRALVVRRRQQQPLDNHNSQRPLALEQPLVHQPQQQREVLLALEQQQLRRLLPRRVHSVRQHRRRGYLEVPHRLRQLEDCFPAPVEQPLRLEARLKVAVLEHPPVALDSSNRHLERPLHHRALVPRHRRRAALPFLDPRRQGQRPLLELQRLLSLAVLPLLLLVHRSLVPQRLLHNQEDYLDNRQHKVESSMEQVLCRFNQQPRRMVHRPLPFRV